MTAPVPAGDPFEALGDPNRRTIVELLGAGERSVQEIADTLPISRPAVSRHLRLLKDAGLVTGDPRGTRRIYRLHDAGIAAVRAYLERVWGQAGARRLVADNPPPGPAIVRGRRPSRSSFRPHGEGLAGVDDRAG
jgi:DNA-binding transcriptional ArsR family regulator